MAVGRVGDRDVVAAGCRDGPATAAVVAGGVVAFVAIWGGLMPLQRHTADPLRDRPPRFPTPREAP